MKHYKKSLYTIIPFLSLVFGQINQVNKNNFFKGRNNSCDS